MSRGKSIGKVMFCIAAVAIHGTRIFCCLVCRRRNEDILIGMRDGVADTFELVRGISGAQISGAQPLHITSYWYTVVSVSFLFALLGSAAYDFRVCLESLVLSVCLGTHCR